MLELLEQLFRQVRGYAQSERLDRKRIYQQSPKHTTMQFDRDAEDIIIQRLKESVHGFEVITEERATFNTNEDPLDLIILDPLARPPNLNRAITHPATPLT